LTFLLFFYKKISDLGIWFGFRSDLVRLSIWFFGHLGGKMYTAARQATVPCGSFWRAKLMTSDDLGNFLTRVTTFHDLFMTLTTRGDAL